MYSGHSDENRIFSFAGSGWVFSGRANAPQSSRSSPFSKRLTEQERKRLAPPAFVNKAGPVIMAGRFNHR